MQLSTMMCMTMIYIIIQKLLLIDALIRITTFVEFSSIFVNFSLRCSLTM